MDPFRLVPIQPYDWPQDKVQIPPGQSIMPAVDPLNKYFSRREGFAYSGEITVNVSQTGQFVIATDADADFWCNAITLSLNGVSIQGASANPKFQVTDLRTGEDMFFPFARLLQFAMVNNNEDTGPNVGIYPPVQSVWGTFIQPFCFTRNGGIQVSLDTNFPTPGLSLTVPYSFTFLGWKEYRYASK